MPEPPILDCFTLFGPVPPRGVAHPGTEDLIALLQRHKVAGAITVSTRGLYYSAGAGNRETAALCRAAGGMLQPAAILDPRVPAASQSVAGARLLCLMPATQRWPINFAPLNELLSTLASTGSMIPLLWESSRIGDATAIRDAIAQAGLKAPVLLGSLTADTLVEAIAVARGNDRFSLVTNGLVGVGEIGLCASSIGAGRVLFGSGAPISSLGAALAVVRRAGLSTSDFEMVVGGNTRRLLAAAPGASA